MFLRITYLLIFINFIKDLNCVEIVQLVVPNTVSEGNNARLKCVYSFGPEERMYSLKWFLGRIEFYRETSNGKHLKQSFPLKRKFSVDLSNSGNGSVFLRSLTIEASGNYNCEVTTNPNKDTASHSQEMIVKERNNSSSTRIHGWIWLYLPVVILIGQCLSNNLSRHRVF